MATGVSFGNPRSLILQPGAYSSVSASALNIVPPFAYNTVCVIGAGLGGTPLTPYLFNDPVQAQELFGATTPLAEAIRFAFQGGSNGGAASVVGVRVDNCAQAYGTLAAVNGGAGLSGTFKDYGAYGNTFSVAFYPGSVAGTMAIVSGTQLNGEPFSQKFDNQTSFSALIERISAESPVTVKIDSGGVSASQTLQLATSQVDGRATLVDSQAVSRSNQVYGYQYPASMLANTEDSLLVTFSAAINWAISSVNDSTDVFTSAAHTLAPGNFVRFVGDALPTVTASKTYVVYVTASSTTFQVAEVLTGQASQAITAFDAGTDIFTAPGNDLADGDVVQISGVTLPTGLTNGRNYFVVGTAGDTFQVATTAGGSAIALSGTGTGLKVLKIAGGAVDITSTTVTNASVILLPGLTTISASDPAEFNGSRLTGTVQPSRTASVSGATVTAAAYSSDSARITLSGAEKWGNISGYGLPGSIFVIASGAYTGTYQILHFEWDGLSTDKTRIVRKLSGDRTIQEGTLTATLSFWGSIQFSRLQPATTQLETRLPANGLLATGGQYLTVVVGDKTAYYATQIGDQIESVGQAIADLINQDDEFPVAASAVYNAGTYTSTLSLVAESPGTSANDLRVSILVNVQNTLLVSAGGATLTGGVDPNPPRNAQGVTSGALVLGNGFDSVPTYQRWLEGLDRVKYLPVRWLVPAGTDNIGVQVAFSDHCTLMSSTPQRRERMTVLGHGLGWSPLQVRERAEVFQSERVVFVSPDVTVSDSLTGNPKRYPAYYTAAMVAGMLAAEGNGISDPITHTYMRNIIAVGISYQPGSTELDRMIESGVLVIERDPSITSPSRGFRVTRAITTYRVTVNSALKSNAFQSISIINQSDYTAAVIREMEETLFIGSAIYPETLEQVRLAVNLTLDRLTRERFLYGYDAGFTQVQLNQESSNALDVVYRVYPLPGLEFILNSQLLAPIPVAA